MLSPQIGYVLMIGLGATLLAIALIVRTLVSSTNDFIIAGRRIGFGLGVGSVISVWTWSMAVMMSSAQAFTFGTSGLLWFVVPNGLAVIAMIPFASYLRRRMPQGYTIIEFIRFRFENRVATSVMLISILFMLICEILINLFGIVLVMQVVFNIKATVVLVIALVMVTLYSYFGGLWTAAITATLSTLSIAVPASLVVLYALAKAGGADLVFNAVDASSDEAMKPFSPAAASAFGISLALGMLASTMADQTFWQKAWSMKPASMARTFLWAGLWFYPIPLVMGILGFIGISQGVTTDELGEAGAGGIGPYVVTHLSLPVVIIALYVLIILQACYSTIDGAFSALSSVIAVDVVKPLRPGISDKHLLRITKASIIIAGIVGGGIVMTGVDYINTVNTIYFLKAGLILPLGLAIFWRRTSATAFVLSIVVSLITGYIVRETVNELAGVVALLSVSHTILVVASLLSHTDFSLEENPEMAEDELAAAQPSTTDRLAQATADVPVAPPITSATAHKDKDSL